VAFWLFLLSALHAPESEPRHYRCLDDTSFTLRLTDKLAIVEFADGQYRLPRRSSAIAIKYATDKATLYLDGDFAAFVADDRPLPGCIRATPVERG
jgi:hypothetical protein